jgi:DNA-binding transcriptional MerR regulator
MIENQKTAGELSQTLGVTTATLRNYVSKFGQFLSPDATRKTRKRFSPEDVQTLLIAKSLLDDGLTYDQVSDQLQAQPLTGEVIDDLPPETQPEDIPPADEIPSAIQSIEFFSQVIENLSAEHKNALTAKDEMIGELRQDKTRQQREISWLRLPWYRKLFNDPPE